MTNVILHPSANSNRHRRPPTIDDTDRYRLFWNGKVAELHVPKHSAHETHELSEASYVGLSFTRLPTGERVIRLLFENEADDAPVLHLDWSHYDLTLLGMPLSTSVAIFRHDSNDPDATLPLFVLVERVPKTA